METLRETKRELNKDRKQGFFFKSGLNGLMKGHEWATASLSNEDFITGVVIMVLIVRMMCWIFVAEFIKLPLQIINLSI